MNRKSLYDKWVTQVCDFIKKVGPVINLPAGAMQSNMEYVLKNDIDVFILGHDEHLCGGPDYKFSYTDNIRNRFYCGNPCWNTRSAWHIWRNLWNAFDSIGDTSLMDNLDKLVFTNAVFFTGDTINQVNNSLQKSSLEVNVEMKCMDFTRELVFDIIKPKVLVCLSVDAVYDKLSMAVARAAGSSESDKFQVICGRFMPKGSKHNVTIAEYNGVRIIGIPHSSGAHGVIGSLPVIARLIKYIKDADRLDKNEIEVFCNSAEIPGNRLFRLADAIQLQGSKQWVYNNKALVHEYYTATDKNGRYCKSNRNIAIDLYQEGDGTLNAILFSRQNDVDVNKHLVEEIWNGNVQFTPDKNNPTRHLCKSFPPKTTDEEIAKYYDILLKTVKNYRDQEYPLPKQ